MAQERMTGDSEPVKRESQYSAPDIETTLSNITNVSKKIRVVHGANEHYFDNLQGKTVGMVRKSLREVLNIPGDAEAFVGGKTVGDDFVLEDAMSVEFSRNSGVKG